MTSAANIIPISIEDELRQSYMDYAMSVIIGRALPDVRDGLKPVHRRILYAMHELGNRWNAAYKKSARVVGDVIGKYHPHGDSAVYDALVRLAQEFNMSLPLVDGQGNFGSVDGDPPAAMRYTEVRMARAASELLSDIDKDTVAWGPNYDDTLEEPLVLPARIPNLLVNGAEGIAVGMATKIPPHNLGEIVDGVIALIEDPTLDVRALMRLIQGPDFPTAGQICGISGIFDAYSTGRGSVTMRARTEVEEVRKNRTAIIVTELPYQVNKARLIERIAELVKDKEIDEISDIRDESDRHGIRVVIELKMGAVPEVVLNNLYLKTAMQQNFGVILLAIVGGQPKVMPLKEILEHFIDFRRDVVTRRTRYELERAREREHILEGLLKALDHIDAVIRVIRESRTTEDARAGLMAAFGLSAPQVQAILDMRLQKLTGLERDKLLEELVELRGMIAEYVRILTSEARLMEVIVEELREVRAQHAVARRTEIQPAEAELSALGLIAEEDMVITISHRGYIKRSPLAEYRMQKRGGKGKRGMTTRDEDFVEKVLTASTHDTILVFTTLGRVFKLPAHEIPQGMRAGKGKALVNLLAFEPGEKMAEIVAIRDFDQEQHLLFATRKGKIKRTPLGEFRNIYSRGLRAINLVDGDDLIAVAVVDGGGPVVEDDAGLEEVEAIEPEGAESEGGEGEVELTEEQLTGDFDEPRVLLATSAGRTICFALSQVRPMGRASQGVKGVSLRGDAVVVGLEVVRQRGVEVLTVASNGYGKRTQILRYPVKKRAGMGVMDIDVKGSGGSVVGVSQVTEADGLLFITNNGAVIRILARDIRRTGRNTKGVRIIQLGDGDRLVGVTRIEGDAEEQESGAEVAAQGELLDMVSESNQGAPAPEGV